MKAPALGSIIDYVAWWAEHGAEREALVDEMGRLNFRELHREVRRWQSALSRQGIRGGDRVALLAPPGREFLISFVAATSLGAIWSGLDPRLKRGELTARLKDLEPKILCAYSAIGARSYAAELKEITGSLPRLGRTVWLDQATDLQPFLESDLECAAESRGGVAQDSTQSDQQIAVIVYTSGSSGRPKGAMLHQAGILDFCRLQNAMWPVEPHRVLNFLPISHVGSLVDLTLPALVAGGCVVFQRKFDAANSLRAIEREGITFWASVPSTFIMQMSTPQFATTNLSSVQLIAVEGAVVTEHLARALMRIAPVVTNYGMTETTSAITATEPRASGEFVWESVGWPVGDMEVRVASGSGRGLGVSGGPVGEIEVRSPRCMVGYWRAPEATQQAFTDDRFFRTGDLGSLRSDGRLVLTGRLREMFKSGGYNVYPAELEALIGGLIGVKAVAVVGVSHAQWGEVGVAFLVLDQTGQARSAATLQRVEDTCREQLADYKRPKRFVVVDELPLLPIGKVDRAALRDSFGEGI